MRRLAVPVAISVGLALAACSAAEEQLAPVPVATSAAPASAGSPPPEPINSSWVKRTVMTRSPFGGHPGNYMHDGDFEFSTVHHEGAQLGWLAFDAIGTSTRNIATETGGLCKSGLRCAILEPGTVLLLRGATALHDGVLTSIAAKVPVGTKCTVINPILVSCDNDAVLKSLHTDKDPGPDGWCRYGADVPPKTGATCLYIQSFLKEGTWALLDEATMGPDDGSVVPKLGEIFVPSAAMLATLDRVRKHVIDHTPLGRGQSSSRQSRTESRYLGSSPANSSSPARR